jgi:hypothetical protein
LRNQPGFLLTPARLLGEQPDQLMRIIVILGNDLEGFIE